MADLRIVDAPEIPTENITGEEKLPTGGNGNYSISLDSLADYTKTKKDLADNTSVNGKVNGVRQELETHIEDLLNPHQVTKGQIGLGNVDNTADADKPVSNSTQAAIISAVAPKADKTYVDNQLTLKANKADVYTKSETYTKQESSDLVNSSISTALTPVKSSLDLAKRGILNCYDPLLTYSINERVVLTNGDIVKSTINGNTNNPNVNMTGWVKTNVASQIFDESGLSQQGWNNGVTVPADLLTIPTPKNGNRVFVKSLYKWYSYNSASTAKNNDVTVVGRWEMDVPDVYYASWFAIPNVKTDQTDKLQTGYDYATSKKRPFIIDDHYYVDGSARSAGTVNSDNKVAIKLRSNSVLHFIKGVGKLEQLPTASDSYFVLMAYNIENYVVMYPELIGDRYTHLGTIGEFGYGLCIFQSKNAYIHQPVISKMWGDGIYIGLCWYTTQPVQPTNITVFQPLIDSVRRNGISFTSGDNVKIIQPTVSNTSGTAPESGIDIEPEEARGSQYTIAKITNSNISDATFINNARNIWVCWYNADRHIDLIFSGTTRCISKWYPITIHMTIPSPMPEGTQSGHVYFEHLIYICDTAHAELDFYLEDRGAKVTIDKFTIHNVNDIRFQFVTSNTIKKSFGGLSVNSIISTDLKTVDFSNWYIVGDKSLVNPAITLNFSDDVEVKSADGITINYSKSNIGGYSKYVLGQNPLSYTYPAKKIIVTPAQDCYIQLKNDYRQMTIIQDPQYTGAYSDLFINEINAKLLNGSTKTGLKLTGFGSNITLKNNSTGVANIINLYGSVS